MKRFWKIVSLALICGMLITPQMEAREKNNRSRGQRIERPSSPSNNSRPSMGGVHKDNRQKPNLGANRPDRNKVSRPHCPPTRPYHRPTPPVSFRPNDGCPVLHSILGVAFGTALNLSLEYLSNKGYSVSGHGNDVVYLRNVNEYGYMWPDATLYYGTNGLAGSQFMFSTNYSDRGRYNMVYNSLVNQYGTPISVNNVTNGVVATWWGYDNRYISLEYRPVYANNGQLRYVTTLSFGI